MRFVLETLNDIITILAWLALKTLRAGKLSDLQ